MLELLTTHDDTSRAQMGGKGFALARLTAAGLNVPAWVIVTPPQLDAESVTQVQPDSFPWPEGFIQQLQTELAAINTEDGRFAVRSSAVEEDGASASFAGQFESYLEVARDDVPLHIVHVWQSALSERVTAYRREQGLTDPPPLPAVVIQRMVQAETSGVAFSADAVSGSWSIAVVSAVCGLGEQLVSGETNADTWRVRRNGEVVDYQSANDGDAPILTNKQVQEVAELARRCERFFGQPQDIEWAWADGQLYLLQSRPITTMHQLADPDGELRIWDNSNIAESYGGVTTPLTFSFAHYIYKEVYQQFCMILHVPREVVEANRPVFDGMLGLVRGRVYYNLMSWYRVLALLPGFRLNRRFMEQMMGVKEGMPDSVLAEFEDDRLGARIKDGFRLAWALVGLAKAQLILPAMIRKFYREFNEALTLKTPLEAMRADELSGHFHHLECRLLSRWNAPLVNDFFAMIYFGVLRGLTRKWCDDEDGTLQNGLLCGAGNIVSAEPARRIHEMAEIAALQPDLLSCLNDGSVRDIEEAMRAIPDFKELYDAYLERFADRCLNELKLESPTLRDDPLPLLRSVGALARRIQQGHVVERGSETKLQNETEAAIEERLAGHWLRRMLFRYVLKQARARVRDRENLRFERTRLFGRIRAVFLEQGKRLAAVHALKEPRDVLYLEISEVLGYIEGTATTTDLLSLVVLRKAEFARFSAESPPADRFETRGVVNVGNTFQGAVKPDSDAVTLDLLRGIGCCPGIVRGRARVVHNPAGAEIQPGEILIAEQTDPGWITLFPAASGVLVERGSLLSHSAIVSRELGIPAVVSLQGLLKSINTGDEIEMDGSAGTVRILERTHG